ncbi:MAG: hypothetical protein AAF652_00260 [Cyanobacteria bacterium P01_C01_bin.72]
MKKLHLAISTQNIAETIKDYSARFGEPPCLVIAQEYALWRTDTLNVSIRKDESVASGTIRHLGWEDAAASSMSAEVDVNGIIWENFTAEQQAAEINQIWSQANYQPRP